MYLSVCVKPQYSRPLLVSAYLLQDLKEFPNHLVDPYRYLFEHPQYRALIQADIHRIPFESGNTYGHH